MAASGLVNIAEAAAIEMSMKHKIPRVQLVKLKGIFHGNFESSSPRNGPDIAKCLEKLNGVLPNQSIEPYLKTSLANFTGLFAKESFSNRLERSPSTDSIAVSNFSSDQGSVDSCHYSSTGSDSNSGSSPCSPEEPDRCSRAGSPQSMPPTSPPLYEFQGDEPLDESCSTQSTRTEVEVRTVEPSEAKSSRLEVECRTNDQIEESSRLEVECRTDDQSEEKSKRLQTDNQSGERPSKRLRRDSSEDSKSKLFYLQQQQTDCNVPKNSISETFQSHGPPSRSCVTSSVVVQNGKSSDSVTKAFCKVTASESKVDLSSSDN
ncbi:hypothetical protein JTE90_027605 [Oedothorax gibbosus]|uniref:Uncharacterized protein n=1 Tax=Oedothorax gibbosus TaxID=931172 RepID=A0AAV6VJZ6_9ARAC|nr:hypothetical protein JTE90_027605 [Oedothorax gibbosus]